MKIKYDLFKKRVLYKQGVFFSLFAHSCKVDPTLRWWCKNNTNMGISVTPMWTYVPVQLSDNNNKNKTKTENEIRKVLMWIPPTGHQKECLVRVLLHLLFRDNFHLLHTGSDKMKWGYSTCALHWSHFCTMRVFLFIN